MFSSWYSLFKLFYQTFNIQQLLYSYNFTLSRIKSKMGSGDPFYCIQIQYCYPEDKSFQEPPIKFNTDVQSLTETTPGLSLSQQDLYLRFAYQPIRKSQGEESVSCLPKYSSKWISIFFSLPNPSNNKKQISVFHTAYHKGYILGKNSKMAYKSHPIWLRY